MSKFSNLGPDEEAALRYDALSNSLGLLGMAVYVAEGERFIQVSEAFERFTGYDAAHPELIPPVSRLVAPADLEKLSQIREARLAGSVDVVRRQWRLVRKDGTLVPVEVISRSYLEGGLLRTAGLIRDLTAERAAEEALEESRTRLQTIIDTALSAVVTMDGKGTITSWNRQAERCFGWPAKEAVGRDLAETIIPLRRRDEHRGGLARYLETGEGPVLGRLVEMEALHRDGSEFPVEIAISPASRQAEGVTFVAFVRDITERRREESARAAEYEINSTLVRATSWTEAAPGVLQALCVHLRWDLAEYWGQIAGENKLRLEATWRDANGDIRDAAPETDGEAFVSGSEVAGRVRATGGPIVIQNSGAADGPSTSVAAVNTASAVGFPITSGQELMGVIVLHTRQARLPDGVLIDTVMDIGRQLGDYRKRTDTEAALRALSEELERQAERNYRVLFEGSPVPMMFRDVETMKVVDVNEAALKDYGYSREEFAAIDVRDLWVPKTEENAKELTAASQTGRDFMRIGPITHRRKDGTTMEVLVTSYQVMYGRRPSRFVIIEDVTERERLDRDLRQAQRLESLGQLAGGVAHDFNNLLGVILNFAAFAKTKVQNSVASGRTQDLDAATNDMDRVIRAAESASRLTHQLLAFARREVVRPRPLDVNSVVGELEPLLRRTIGEHIEFDTALQAEPWSALIDPGRLEQVLTNLSVNARDAMESGGKLLIETSNVDVDEAYAGGRAGLKPGRYVALRVSDTGSGMDADTLRHVFEPFFTTKPRGRGTGLGLATVHGIVNQAGGHISIYSELGLGTRVTVLLPATEESPAEKAQPAVAPQPGAGETILIVEDADDLREITEQILIRNGYRVIAASGGEGALGVAAHHAATIDLLLTDVVMPGMQGSELAARLGSTHPETRVLFMSGYPQPMLGPKGAVGLDLDLLDKPFTEAILVGRVQQALAKRLKSDIRQGT